MKETLFNSPKNKFITSVLLNGEKVKRIASNFKFRLSVYGILIEDGKILLQKNPTIESLCIPGGGVEIDEKMEDALVREFREETGIIVEVGDQIGTIENFFTLHKQDAHAILVFYYVHRKEQSPVNDTELSSDSEYTQFVEIDNLSSTKVLWVFRKFFKTFPIV